MSDLAQRICEALRDHDPLDPWLTESAWDEDYWDGEAAQIAGRLRSGMSAREVRAIVVDVLGELLGHSADGQSGLDEQARRLDRIATTIADAIGR